ncbi:hypothetical protein K8D10_22685 [Aeromonas veronii]|uniref:hypothetical protein n=1 Tax=Aeromonas veronii TaxID=654 RepID=UPI00207CC5BF|nr:hypothetical protein [Aeromonas veronii]MCO4174553.1 hypothetical protein [Aeromonas veronii]
MTRNEIEQFLLHIEQNEDVVFEQYTDYLLLPIVPFFQLVHVQNTQQVINNLLGFESASNGFFIRVDGYLTLACEDHSIRDDDLRRITIQLFETMRF